MKIFVFDLNSTEVSFWVSNWQKVIIGLVTQFTNTTNELAGFNMLTAKIMLKKKKKRTR